MLVFSRAGDCWLLPSAPSESLLLDPTLEFLVPSEGSDAVLVGRNVSIKEREGWK